MLASHRLLPYTRRALRIHTTFRRSLNLHPDLGVKKSSYSFWLKAMIAAGTVGSIAYYHFLHWYYMFPVQSGMRGRVPYALEPMDEHQEFLEKLQVPRHPDRNRVVLLFGDQGVGKSMAVSHILQSEHLKKWYLSEHFFSYLPRALTPPYLKERPWFLLRYQGSLDDSKNMRFKNAYLDALKDTQNKFFVNTSPDADIPSLLRDMSSLEGLRRTVLRVASIMTGLNFSKEMKEDEKKALNEFSIFLEEHPGWVIILDDIQSRDGIREFLPTKGGTIIYTTNTRSSFDLPKENCIEFYGFTQKQAENFITCKLENETKTEDVNKLLDIGKNNAKKETYNPLLLDQICSVIVEDKLSIIDYLDMFNKMPIELFSRFSRDREMHDHLPIVKSLELTLSLLRTNPVQKNYGLKLNLTPEEKLLFIITSFASVSISDKLVEDIFCSSDSSTTYASAKGKLTRHRLITSEGETKDLSMHPLFHKIFREIFIEDMKNLNSYSGLLTVLYHWMKYETLIDQQLKTITIELKEIGRPLVTELTIFNKLLLHSQALDNLCSKFDRHYYQNESFLNHLSTLGTAYFHKGDYAEAKALHERALATTIAHYKTEEHVSVANTQYDLALTLDTLDHISNYAKAKTLYEKALATKIAHYKTEEHVSVAQIQQTLAITLKHHGDYAEAKALLEKALATKIAHYKTEEHVSVAGTQQNLAVILMEQKDYVGSKTLLEKALKTTIERYQTEEHLDVATMQQNLAVTLTKQEDYEGAKALYEKALKTTIKHYQTEEHIKVAIIKCNLAGLFARQQKNIEALSLLEECEFTFKNQPGGAQYLPDFLRFKKELNNKIYTEPSPRFFGEKIESADNNRSAPKKG